jgi:hypothetical protein
MPGKIVWKTAVRRLVEQGVLKVEQANKIYRRIELQ